MKFIEVNENKMEGLPVLMKRRITVSQILSEIADNFTPEDVEEDLNLDIGEVTGMLLEIADLFKSKDFVEFLKGLKAD